MGKLHSRRALVAQPKTPVSVTPRLGNAWPWASLPGSAPTRRELAENCSAQPGDMTHFAPRPRLALAVEMQIGARLADDLGPALDLGPDEIFHHRLTRDQ